MKAVARSIFCYSHDKSWFFDPCATAIHSVVCAPSLHDPDACRINTVMLRHSFRLPAGHPDRLVSRIVDSWSFYFDCAIHGAGQQVQCEPL